MVDLKYGPLNKSLFTQELELFVKCLIQAPEKIQFSIQDSPDTQPNLHGKMDEIDIDVSALLRKANHSHIQLNQEDSASFLPHFRTSVEFSGIATLSPLTNAEYQAIQRYTGSYYVNINRALQHKFVDLLLPAEDPLPPLSDRTLEQALEHPIPLEGGTQVNQLAAKELVINTSMLASGLNKIMPTLEPDALSYRGEHRVTLEEINERILVIEQGSGLTEEPTFMSTSIDETISRGFSTHSLIIFDGIFGKSISALSHFPEEEEFLLPPSPILWESHEEKDGYHIFHAKMVAPLIDGKDEVSTQDLDTFTQLQRWAQQQGVDTGFLTPHLLETLSNTPSQNHTLQLQDCVDFEAQAPHSSASLFNESHPIALPPSMALQESHPIVLEMAL